MRNPKKCCNFAADFKYITMQKRNLSFAQLFNLSFGFFGVQIAYALQSANISRIFATLGADPHQLSLFWLLPPLMGMIVQPLIGKFSDKTWNKLGRRKPYLLIGAIIAVAVMIMLPMAGDFFPGETGRKMFIGFTAVIWFGIFSLIFLDTSINIAMQPFKMMVGDMVNEEQKGLAYSIQSFLCNAGSLVGYLLPFCLTAWFFNNVTTEPGHVAPSVQWSFYIGAAVLILCVLYTFFAVKEMPPKEYAEFHGIDPNKKEEKSPNFLVLLKNAPKTFWTVGLVQFFCWSAFLYMWTYSTGAVAQHAIGAKNAQAIDVYTDAAGNDITHTYVQYNNELIVSSGVLKSDSAQIILTTPGNVLQLASVKDGDVLSHPEEYTVAEGVVLKTKTDIDVSSPEYGRAGDWVGVLFAIQAIGSVLWAMVIPLFKRRRKLAYSLSLIIGAIGFILSFFCTDTTQTSVVIMKIPTTVAQLELCGCYLLIGCAWAAMLAVPFTIVTNSIKEHMGSYLGLFNCSICLPQIVAAAVGGLILGCFPEIDGVAQQPYMLVVAGVLLLFGALSVLVIKEKE